MLMSKLFFSTLREKPSDAEVISHQLLLRAGYIRKVASGIYNYLPLMKRTISKIEAIIREEMNRAGAQELLMPFIQPEELWKKSGRWEVYGKELVRLEDRKGNGMTLSPTHEEVITELAGDTIQSYKQLPVNLYQIQTKFRDEIRPRFGLLRGREFIMKDAYSFHRSQECLDKEYDVMAEAYKKIFQRCGMETRMVRGDSGAIGGSVSHEFMLLTDNDSGENDVLFCESCDYAANSNHAGSKLVKADTDGKFSEAKKAHTPNIKSIETLAKFFNIPQSAILKSIVYIADEKPVVAIIRGDLEIEETKLKNAIRATEIRLATDTEIKELTGIEAGFIGPEGLNAQLIGDISIKELKNFVMGINKTDYHLVGANFGSEIKMPKLFDIRLAKKGEGCPLCSKPLNITKGIEVGNIFQLGTKYSSAMGSTFTDEDGRDKPFIMGCYGIGVTRVAAAAIEKYHDEWGIMLPRQIAPYHVIIVPVNSKDELQMNTSKELYQQLLREGIEVVLDDRNERAGVKFKDADLIGFPYKIVVGKTITEGKVEFKERSGEKVIIDKDKVLDILKEQLA